MNNTKEILHCVLQIEKLNAERSYSDMLVLLGDLDKHHITSEQLETIDIVQILYRILKSCKDVTVKKTVKSILAKWKKEYSKERREIGECSTSTRLTDAYCKDETFTKQDYKPENASISNNYSTVRSKCVHLLMSAISQEPSDHDKASNLAKNIETHIHKLHKSNQAKYKTCIRSKLANLKNTKSAHLREGLLNGSLSPQVFAQMSTEEMANSELRRLRQEYSAQSVNERQLPQNIEGTRTEKIRCKSCDGMDCRVAQVSRGTLFLPTWVKQSGPDDDSMTFVTCNRCGQQWYHNNWVTL